MVKVLNGLAVFFIVVGIVSGIILGNDGADGFRWGAALTWWVSGIVTGILFFAVAIILDYVEDTNARVRNLEYELILKNASRPAPTNRGNAKADLNKLRGLRLGNPED
ncbi:hypothetical protein [Cohnella hashimotonis]|uniref:Uncharacterized protein n=1 Tax=Cohnella hashimotonis TaxID=2826895 RepID=A0ABT6TCQ9_9BACL|nr:hypothetical protein [Cohnella hashimotonis]MDI4643617.1 hypothetical protein [Cohnella hashimotonis]